MKPRGRQYWSLLCYCCGKEVIKDGRANSNSEGYEKMRMTIHSNHI
jgi:hypothetical protein